MEFNLITNINACIEMVQQSVPVSLVYYSHIPSILASTFLGVFILVRSRYSISGKLILGILASFSFWMSSDIFLWTSHNSQVYMFFWSLLIVWELLTYLFSLFLIQNFIFKKGFSLCVNAILFLISLPILILAGTKYNVAEFSLTDCIPVDTNFYQNYVTPFHILIIVSVIIIGITGYIKHKNGSDKKQIMLMTLGVSIFLTFYAAIETIINYLIDNVGIDPTRAYTFEMCGLAGLPIFIVFLAYLIVKYKAFNIKLLGAQALVVALVALVASEFFFTPIDNTTNIILISVTVLLSSVFGIWLINSVKNEVKRKEELQQMSNKLAEANDELRKLDNAKSEFISIASHQLRTPLTAIKGFVSLLLEGSYGKLDRKQEDVLNKVYLSNNRLIVLVEDLLNISRIESGRMEFRFEMCQVEDICREVMDDFIVKAKEHKLSLEYKKQAESLPKIMIDGGKIREVISNIIDNAIKYTPKGGVTIKTEKVSGGGQKISSTEGAVRVIVSDTGIGIPKTELPYLFTKFSRGKDIKRLNAVGTGLGLYVGKSMIEANGGEIWAESDGQDKGSRFIIELPIGENKAEVEKRFEKFIEKL
jgi:signal transduction histidine kinase